VLDHSQLPAVAGLRPAWPWLPLPLPLSALPLGLTLAIGALTVLHEAGHQRLARARRPNVLAIQTSLPLGLWVRHWSLKHRVHHRVSQVCPLDESTRSSSLLRLRPQTRSSLPPLRLDQPVRADGQDRQRKASDDFRDRLVGCQ